MKLILARHGNTFRPDESAYYVGAQHDLPLVDYGLVQAQEIGKALAKLTQPITAVYAGPLLRMQATARNALTAMQSSLELMIDDRLNELDYGLWSGLTSQQVREKFGDHEYENWEKKSLWPAAGQWAESEKEVIERITQFAQNLTQRHASDETILVVASNGCLRYFLHLVAEAFAEKVAQGQLKIGTGHLCQLQYIQEKWRIEYWNRAPSTL